MGRKIRAYKNYFTDFITSISELEARKVFYVLDMLKMQERFQKKSQKTPRKEIELAIRLKNEYYAEKGK